MIHDLGIVEHMASSVGEASSSSSSLFHPASASIQFPPHRSCAYHVFLSFRGEDTRKGFTDHLCASLERKGIITFRDDKDLQRGGDVISVELLKAIEESMFAIIVLSPNYASSCWCLDELQKIVECSKNTMMGLSVVAVFYGVEPSDVRHQKGRFGEAFRRHEERFGHNSEKVQRWRDALTQVANLRGWNSKDQHEATLVENIASHIHKNLIPKLPSCTENLVGITSRMNEVYFLLGMGLNDTRFVGIWGMGGIGKTTIARSIYEAIQAEFKASCFIANIREISETNGLVQIQRQLISQLNMSRTDFYNIFDGEKTIQNSLHNKKVLLVLDDVNEVRQLENLAGKQSWFGPGSRIIITTRDMHVLNTHGGVYGTYKVERLLKNEALHLFCLKAFKQDQPEEGFLDLSKEVVKYCDGLPLALEVLGSYLYGRSVDVWGSAIRKMKSIPHAKILDTLKISYEGLDIMEKNIFLDIACFFSGMNKDYVTDILEKCGYNPKIDIDVLMERSLVTLNRESNKLEMHDLIQEMGRNIVIQESPNDPGKRSRLWSQADIDHVLTKNKGTEAIQGILLSPGYVASWSPEAFSKTSQLKFLILCDMGLPLGLSYLPTSLKVLHWRGCPLETLPLVEEQYEIVEMSLRGSGIKHLWHGKKFLEKLKYLDLSFSWELKKTPDFSAAPVLETLVLEHCEGLIEIHPSLIHHKNIVLLNLSSCTRLKSFPGKLEMSSLRELILSDCISFENLPEFGECMKHLSNISLDGTFIRVLPASLQSSVALSDLNFGYNINFVYLPSIFSEAYSSTSGTWKTHQVFLNYKEHDIHAGFIDHLRASLQTMGITTFRFDDDKVGEVISDELFIKAIEESMSAIVVLSPKYAFSTRCLDELHKILECNLRLRLSVAIVFYGVDPSDVRHQRGTFEEAFREHELRFGQDREKVQRWKIALTRVANYSGWVYNDHGLGSEHHLLRSITQHIQKMLNPKLKLPS